MSPALALPASRPRLSSAELGLLLTPYAQTLAKYPLFVAGYRGYYADTMGEKGANDRGIYDDALFVVSPNVFVAFNANTDPSGFRKGEGTGATAGMATLKPGLYLVHRFDLHRGKYLALCQRAGPVTVIRDGDPPYEETGNFGINIHKGSVTSTSSLGCQTIHPSQWDSCIALAVSEAKRLSGAKWKTTTVPYALIDTRAL